MADMMKSMGGAAGKRGMMGKLGKMMGIGGGMPQPTPEEIEAMQKQLGGAGVPGRPPRRLAYPPRRRPARSICRRSFPACRRRPEAPGPWRRVQPVRRGRRK